MSDEKGLRERKKQQTRALVTDTARRLFAQRGFDQVTLAEVARAADVSQGTLFNYFPRKEDLVLSGLEARQEELLRTVRERRAGEPILAAFQRFVIGPRQLQGLLGSDDPRARAQLAEMTRIIVQSPTLLARENQIFEQYTNALAQLIADETGKPPHDVEPWVAANAMVGAHRALLSYVRRQVLAGTDHQQIRRNLTTQRKRALAQLEQGLARSLQTQDDQAARSASA